MAKPRIFISSTFYDLRHVRANLERFIKELGYDPVLSEHGNVPYQNREKLEEYCYREIEHCDILISIIGGRYGSEARSKPYSISQMEFKTAIELNRQVYIFVDNSVWSEYRTFLQNRENEDIVYNFVDDVKVYRFIEEVESLPNNNPIHGFENTQDIISFLREQWAGLFKNFLQEQTRDKEINILSRMEKTAGTLDQIVTFLTEERKNQSSAIQDILLSNHPAFQSLAKLTNTPYRVFFTTYDEMKVWLNARGFTAVDENEWDDPNFEEWLNRRENKGYLLSIYTEIFDDSNRLKIFTPEEWDKKWITKRVLDYKGDDDDIPF